MMGCCAGANGAAGPHELPGQHNRHTRVMSVELAQQSAERAASLGSRGACDCHCFLLEMRCLVQNLWTQAD